MQANNAPRRSAAAAEASDDAVVQSLYASSAKVYPRQVHGLFAALRLAGVIGLLGIFYGLPWLQWGDRQAVLLDLPARRFHLFGLTLWPQDLLYLAALLIIAGLSLFFFTALAGRLWCGYACPQTVWTEVFMWMERLVEGDRPQQMKLDRAPMSPRKLRIKATKHALWIAFSLYTGYSFVGYFTPIRELTQDVMSLSLGGWETFWILFYGFATYGNAGWMREQVCKYMCPYARFQSAMFDRDTLTVYYDRQRGEPRGGRRSGIDPRTLGLGDCINCSLCVQVCPTGIDIRDGLQYECIGCSACIDACNGVMDRMGYPRGLIRYTSENALEGRPTRILRPRILIYGTVLLALILAVGFGLAQRVPLHVEVLRDRNQLYRETEDALIENVYTLKIHNMDETPHHYELKVAGIEGATLLADDPAPRVEAGQVGSFPVRVQADEANLPERSNAIEFIVQAQEDLDLLARHDARFLGPGRRP